MHKKHRMVLIITLVLLAALLLPACAEPTPTPTTPAPTTPAPTTPAPATPVPTTPTTPAPTNLTMPTPTTPAPTILAEPKILRLAYTMPKGASVGAGFEWFAVDFERRTQGRYKVETYPDQSLVSIPAALDSVKSGAAEIVVTSTETFPNDFQLTLVTSLPTLGFSMKTLDAYSAAYDACWELYNRFPEIQAEFKDFKLLWLFELDPYNIVSKKKEIHYPSDFNGVNMGGSGQKMDIVTANGGASVHQIPPQSYPNLDEGVVDAVFLTLAQVKDYGLWEICDYFYTQDFGCGTMVILMNLEAWNAMSPQDQKLIMDTWRDASVESAKNSLEELAEGTRLILEAGKEVTDPKFEESRAWEKAAEPVFKTWADDAKSSGVDAQVVIDVFAAWKEIRKKYTK